MLARRTLCESLEMIDPVKSVPAELCDEYAEKVAKFVQPIGEWSNEELSTYLEYAFCDYEKNDAIKESAETHMAYALLMISFIERKLAGHNESAAVFKLCKCEWCERGCDDG